MNALCLLLAALTPGAGPPPLRAVTPNATLGEVNANKSLVHTFHLENAGAEPITVLDVKRACACMKQELGTKALAPGEKTSLTVSFNLMTQPEGPGQWNVAVRYAVIGRDGTQELPLTVSATVKKDVRVEPVSLVMIGSADLSGKVTVFDRRGKPLNVTGARLGVAKVTTTVEKADGGERRQTVRITADDMLPVGTHADELAIDTDDPEYRELRVPVRIVKTAPAPAVRASPAAVKLQGAGASKVVTVSDRDDRDIDIEAVTASEPFLSVKWAKGPGGDAAVRVTLDGAPNPPAGRGTITVKLKQPAASPLTILVEWSR